MNEKKNNFHTEIFKKINNRDFNKIFFRIFIY